MVESKKVFQLCLIFPLMLFVLSLITQLYCLIEFPYLSILDKTIVFQMAFLFAMAVDVIGVVMGCIAVVCSANLALLTSFLFWVIFGIVGAPFIFILYAICCMVISLLCLPETDKTRKVDRLSIDYPCNPCSGDQLPYCCSCVSIYPCISCLCAECESDRSSRFSFLIVLLFTAIVVGLGSLGVRIFYLCWSDRWMTIAKPDNLPFLLSLLIVCLLRILLVVVILVYFKRSDREDLFHDDWARGMSNEEKPLLRRKKDEGLPLKRISLSSN